MQAQVSPGMGGRPATQGPGPPDRQGPGPGSGEAYVLLAPWRPGSPLSPHVGDFMATNPLVSLSQARGLASSGQQCCAKPFPSSVPLHLCWLPLSLSPCSQQVALRNDVSRT